jgi:hypothetical protein
MNLLGAIKRLVGKPEPAPQKEDPGEPTTKSGQPLSRGEETLFRTRAACPDCLEPVCEGPHGGLSINYICSNASCGSRFNDTGPFGVDRITDASPNRTQGVQ